MGGVLALGAVVVLTWAVVVLAAESSPVPC